MLTALALLRRTPSPIHAAFLTIRPIESTMTQTSKAERRWAHEQALASTRIEGHQPSPEFMADCEAVVEGTMTNEAARAASLARALARDGRVVDGGRRSTDMGQQRVKP